VGVGAAALPSVQPGAAWIGVEGGAAAMNPLPQSAPERRSLWLGAPGSDDSKRSQDEIRIIKEMTTEEVENFLRINCIDTAAAKELRTEPPHVALAVLERGPLRACTNPSGALVARIRDAKRGILQGGGRFGQIAQPAAPLDANASEADKFLSENRIDQAGAASFRCETAEVQKAVMAKGPLVNTTNPSASLMARIRNVKVNAQNAQNSALSLGMGGAGNTAGVLSAQQPLAGLVSGGGQTLAASPPLALEDGRSAVTMDDEVQKAIGKLQAASQPGVGLPQATQASAPPSHLGQQPPTGAPGPIMTNNADQRLQDEALKAIQALNAAGPHPDEL